MLEMSPIFVTELHPWTLQKTAYCTTVCMLSSPKLQGDNNLLKTRNPLH